MTTAGAAGQLLGKRVTHSSAGWVAVMSLLAAVVCHLRSVPIGPGSRPSDLMLTCCLSAVVGGQISPFPVDFHRRPYNNYCKKLNSLKHLVRTTVAELHN